MAKMEPTTSPLPFANPFGPLVGQPLDDNQVDIADINADAFHACQRLVNDVAAGGFSAALTVFGDSGTGKTHLIGRVRKWLEKNPGNLFVFVRMETSPAGIWRHLRRNLALALLRKNAGDVRTLDSLLAGRWNHLDTFADRDLGIVLENLHEGRHVRDSSAWLRGEALPEDILRAMSLSAPAADDDLEVTSRHTVLSLCALMRPGVVAFCMDQIEAIMSSPGDKEGPHSFGRMVSCLVEETRNAAIICCEQSSFANLMLQILDNSAQQKVMGRRTVIRPLSWEQSKRLIRARLETVPELAAERVRNQAGWPLTESQFRALFKDDAAPARKVIERCKDLFDEWQTGQPVMVETLPVALEKMLEDRFAHKDAGQSEAIIRNGMPLLARACGLKYSVVNKPSPLDFQMNEGKVSIAICNESGNALTNRLKKLQQVWKPSSQQSLLLLRDGRNAIGKTAKVAHKSIQSLQKQGGRLVTISQEAIDALAALRRLLSDAESGDLTHHGETVSSATVEQWIAGHLPGSLDPLVSELGTKEAALPALADLLAEKKLVTVAEAARTLEVTVGEIEAFARRDPRQFGLLGGSLPVLFQPVASSEAR